MRQSNAAVLVAARMPVPAQAALPPDTKWSPRRTLLFVLLASTLGWMTILVPLMSGR